MAQTRNDDGTYASGHDADPDAVLDAMDAGEPYTTGEVAELFDAPRRTIYNYLSELVDRGDVAVKYPMPRTAIWIKD